MKAEGKLVETSEPVAEAAKPEPPPDKAPDISIHDAVEKGNIEAVKQHIAAGTDVNAKGGLIGGTLCIAQLRLVTRKLSNYSSPMVQM